MNININIDDIDTWNSRKIHESTATKDLVGTIIHSDEWKAYTPLRNNRHFYTHATVKSITHFIL
jgi:hypothetical protein